VHITIIDRSNGKLILFLPALNALQQLGLPVYVQSAQKDTAEQLERLAEQIGVRENLPENRVDIVLADTPEAIFSRDSSSLIVYPLISETDATSFEQMREKQTRIVPLSGERLLGHALGDVRSLTDFVRKDMSEPILKGKRILISAGPTAEDLDPVRYLTNRSSGKMGVALARAAFILGAEIHLVFGPGQAEIPAHISVDRVRSARQMAQAVFNRFDWCDVYIGAAAVADFTPAGVATEKIKKSKGTYRLPLKRTIDILETLGQQRTRQILVGFSVETQNPVENSLKKLQRKRLDLMIVNNPKEKGAAFAVDTNKVMLIEKDGKVHDWPLMSKWDLSFKIMQFIAGMTNHE